MTIVEGEQVYAFLEDVIEYNDYIFKQRKTVVYFDRRQTVSHFSKAVCYHFSATYSVRKQAIPISVMANLLQNHNTEMSGLITLLYVRLL